MKKIHALSLLMTLLLLGGGKRLGADSAMEF